MFTMMTRLYLKHTKKKKKKTQGNRNRLQEINSIKKKKQRLQEIKYGNVKLQIQDHPNNVPTSKDFKRSVDFSTSSKVRVFHSLQISHIKQANLTYKLILTMVIIRRKT